MTERVKLPITSVTSFDPSINCARCVSTLLDLENYVIISRYLFEDEAITKSSSVCEETQQ